VLSKRQGRRIDTELTVAIKIFKNAVKYMQETSA